MGIVVEKMVGDGHVLHARMRETRHISKIASMALTAAIGATFAMAFLGLGWISGDVVYKNVENETFELKPSFVSAFATAGLAKYDSVSNVGDIGTYAKDQLILLNQNKPMDCEVKEDFTKGWQQKDTEFNMPVCRTVAGSGSRKAHVWTMSVVKNANSQLQPWIGLFSKSDNGSWQYNNVHAGNLVSNGQPYDIDFDTVKQSLNTDFPEFQKAFIANFGESAQPSRRSRSIEAPASDYRNRAPSAPRDDSWNRF